MLRRVLYVGAIVAALVAALAVVGALYQTVNARRDAARFPPPGTLVDVGGRRLHLICAGEGQPTVMFEASGFGSALGFDAVRSEVSAHTKACAYDRMGMGWSDPGPDTISAGVLAEDLRLLQDRAGLRPPFIVVAASIGGLTVEMFARRYPERVSGLVFVDAADSGIAERFAAEFPHLAPIACAAKTAARLGLLRLFDPMDLRQLPRDAAARAIAVLYRVQPWTTVCALARGIPRTLQELREAPALDAGVPLLVLSHEKPVGFLPPRFEPDASTFEPVWRNLQERLAQRSTRGRWRIVEGSGHLIAASHPHAVAAGVLELLAQIRHDWMSSVRGSL